MALYLDGHKYSLFGSDNLLDWQLQQVITLEEDWECPDFYPLPLDGAADNIKWVLCGASDRYLVGEFGRLGFPRAAACPPAAMGQRQLCRPVVVQPAAG